MTDAVAQGDYVDLRFIKGRKVAQIVVEIPIEAADAFLDAFKAPQSDKSVPVAIARLEPSALKQQLQQSVEMERKKGGKLAQQAGILCNEPRFMTFLSETGALLPAENAPEYLRRQCGVKTRADLDHDGNAAEVFRTIKWAYEAWLTQ